MGCTIRPIRVEERILIVGANGTGKSVAATQLLDSTSLPVIAVDVKGDFELNQKASVIRKPNDWRLGLLPNRSYIYRPNLEYMDTDTWVLFFRTLWSRARKTGKKHPFFLYIDEAQFLSTGRVGREMANLAITTRSMGMGLIITSQRPRWIPVEIRTEAWRWFVYWLTYERDRKEVGEYTAGRLTPEDFDRIDENHGFWKIERGIKSPSHLEISLCSPFARQENPPD